MRRILRCAPLVACCIAPSPAARAAISIANPSFELPSTQQYYLYDPNLTQQGGNGWNFENLNYPTNPPNEGPSGSGVGDGPVSPPDGTQAGFIQGAGTFDQTIPGFTAGAYAVSFYLEQRTNYVTDPIQVTIDDVPVTFGAQTSVTAPSATFFTLYTSNPVALTAGSHDLAFAGLGGADGADSDSWVDMVSIVAVTPEPTAIGVTLACLLCATGARVWRRSTCR